MSNILKVFNPPESRDLTPEETRDCVPCQIMATVTALGAGYWFASGQVFRDDSITPQENLKRNPIWWRNSVRIFGVGLLCFGIVRGTEGWIWAKEDDKLEH
jgi:hypothetical protein